MSHAIEDRGDLTAVTFAAPFDLAGMHLFVRCKALPEWRCEYDRPTKVYTVTTPARYAYLLTGQAAPDPERLPMAPHLFDYQAAIVTKALSVGRFAIWADTGLGKTAMFLEWARHVAVHGRVLIISPLQIIAQTAEEWRRFYPGADPLVRLETRDAMVEWCRSGSGVGITNAEKLIAGEVPEWRLLAGLVVDEASILKSFSGKIAQALVKSSHGLRFKLACTATPAPNDTLEYADQARFLETVRHEGEVLFTFFSRDAKGNWHLRPHAVDAFYRFMSGWSIYLRDPKRYGYGDILATLPPPVIIEEIVPMTPEQRLAMMEYRVESGSGMFGSDRMGIRERSKLSQMAKGFTYTDGGPARIPSLKPARVVERVREQVAAGRKVLVWTVFDEESVILRDLLADDPFEVGMLHGDNPMPDRLASIEAFRHGTLDVLITKAVLVGHGLNFQSCRAMVFSGFDDSFERLYQAIRRAYRFGQTETVHVFVPVIPELEGMVWENLERKQALFDRDTAEMERRYIKATASERITA